MARIVAINKVFKTVTVNAEKVEMYYPPSGRARALRMTLNFKF
jgi:hypothetical protein